jgi:K+ transporter
MVEPPLCNKATGTYNKCRCRLGGISAVLDSYLQTTIKYVLITLSADNHGRWYFALYAVQKTKIKWLIVPAIIEVAPYLLTEL